MAIIRIPLFLSELQWWGSWLSRWATGCWEWLLALPVAWKLRVHPQLFFTVCVNVPFTVIQSDRCFFTVPFTTINPRQLVRLASLANSNHQPKAALKQPTESCQDCSRAVIQKIQDTVSSKQKMLLGLGRALISLLFAQCSSLLFQATQIFCRRFLGPYAAGLSQTSGDQLTLQRAS